MLYLKTIRREDWQFVQIAVETRFARWFADQIGEDADISLVSNDFAAVKQAVCEQIGIGILPDFAVSPADRLRAVSPNPDAPPPEFAAELFLVMHEDVRRSPGVRAAADYFGEVLGDDKAETAVYT
ncbi:MAG: LysR substrate-binding domain-containing protein [Neisseria sp.]|nr:LysR substrate-binding domain-containing protein [Neisseria sp.]